MKQSEVVLVKKKRKWRKHYLQNIWTHDVNPSTIAKIDYSTDPTEYSLIQFKDNKLHSIHHVNTENKLVLLIEDVERHRDEKNKRYNEFMNEWYSSRDTQQQQSSNWCVLLWVIVFAPFLIMLVLAWPQQFAQ